MSSYFSEQQEPDPALVELKFKEVVLNIAGNKVNTALLSYFCSMLHEPQGILLKRVMEDNFCFNLKLEVYASLTNRSRSAFKRDFEKFFHSSPGKWLLERRLQHDMQLINEQNKTLLKRLLKAAFSVLLITAVRLKQGLAKDRQPSKKTTAR